MPLTERQKERDREINIGDTVIVRNWDDLKEEFSQNFGDIPCRRIFTQGMKEYSGLIKTIKTKGSNGEISFKETSHGFNWSTDMVEKIKLIYAGLMVD